MFREVWGGRLLTLLIVGGPLANGYQVCYKQKRVGGVRERRGIGSGVEIEIEIGRSKFTGEFHMPFQQRQSHSTPNVSQDNGNRGS